MKKLMIVLFAGSVAIVGAGCTTTSTTATEPTTTTTSPSTPLAGEFGNNADYSAASIASWTQQDKDAMAAAIANNFPGAGASAKACALRFAQSTMTAAQAATMSPDEASFAGAMMVGSCPGLQP